MLRPSPVGQVVPVLPRPRARSIGFTLIVLGGLLLAALAFDVPPAECGTNPWLVTPVGGVLGCIVLFSGMVLVLEQPRTSAVAPGLALGAGLPVLGGAIGGIIWSATSECGSSLLDTHAALLIVQAGAALAVVVTSAWLLYVRDELEPWAGTRGVVLASGAALLVLTLGVGVITVWGTDVATASVLIAALAGPLPWAGAVALTGWLRRSPAIAVVVGGTLQLLAVLWGIMGS